MTIDYVSPLAKRPAGMASPAHMRSLDAANHGFRPFGEVTWHTQADALSDHAHLLSLGKILSEISYDGSRGVYVFDNIDPRDEYEAPEDDPAEREIPEEAELRHAYQGGQTYQAPIAYTTRHSGMASGSVEILAGSRVIAMAGEAADAGLIAAALNAYARPSLPVCSVHGAGCAMWEA